MLFRSFKVQEFQPETPETPEQVAKTESTGAEEPSSKKSQIYWLEKIHDEVYNMYQPMVEVSGPLHQMARAVEQIKENIDSLVGAKQETTETNTQEIFQKISDDVSFLRTRAEEPQIEEASEETPAQVSIEEDKQESQLNASTGILQKISEDISVIRVTMERTTKNQEKELDRAAREGEKAPSWLSLFGLGRRDVRKPQKGKEKEAAPKGFMDTLKDMFGITDMVKSLAPFVSGLIVPMLKSLFGGPLGIIASIGMLIMDVFKGLEFADILGVSKASGIIGAIFGGDLEGGMISAFKNAGKWAMIGAGIGSVVPGVGTLVGGIVGAALGAILGWIGGGQIALWAEQAIDAVANWWDETVVGALDFTDKLEDATAKLKQLFNSFVSGLASGIFNLVGDMFSSLANIEISVPKDGVIGKTLSTIAGALSLPSSIRPFGFLTGAAEAARGAASTTQEYFEGKNASLQQGIDERATARESRHEELEQSKAERATKEEKAAAELERIKRGEQAPETKAGMEPTAPAPTPKPVESGAQLDVQTRELQRAKEMGPAQGNVVAPVTNNVVTTSGPQNTIVNPMPTSRPNESSWNMWRQRTYTPA